MQTKTKTIENKQEMVLIIEPTKISVSLQFRPQIASSTRDICSAFDMILSGTPPQQMLGLLQATYICSTDD
jgi:hypothetical protein